MEVNMHCIKETNSWGDIVYRLEQKKLHGGRQLIKDLNPFACEAIGDDTYYIQFTFSKQSLEAYSFPRLFISQTVRALRAQLRRYVHDR